MLYTRPEKGWGDALHVAFSASFRGCMVDIGHASYFYQSIILKGNILAYFSFFEEKKAL